MSADPVFRCNTVHRCPEIHAVAHIRGAFHHFVCRLIALKREFEQEVVRLLYIYDNIKYIEISKFLYEDEKNLIT